MSRIKTAYKVANAQAKEFGYKGVLDAILNGTEEHKTAVRNANKDYLIKTIVQK